MRRSWIRLWVNPDTIYNSRVFKLPILPWSVVCKAWWVGQNEGYCIFTIQGIVIAYLNTVPWQKYLLKVGLLFDWLHRQHMEPITEDFSLRKQNMFFVEIRKVKIVYPLNSYWKGWKTMIILSHEHLQVRF